MSIALGVHVGVEEVSAVLVEADLPELGPISARTVSVAAAPGGVGDAVTTMLGIMRVQAAQNDLLIAGSAVVCDSIALCGIVRAALAAHQVGDVGVVDAGDPRLNDEVPLGIAAALIGIATGPAVWRGDTVSDGPAPGDGDGSRAEADASDTPRSARLTMIALGVAVLAALSGATVWALTAVGQTQNSVVDTADVTAVAERPSSRSNATGSPPLVVVADSVGAVSSPPAETALFESPVYGPLPVGTWSEVLPTGPVVTPGSEVPSSGGDSGSGGNSGKGDPAGGRPEGGTGGDTDGGDSGGEESPTVEPDPDPEVPSTDPSEPTTEVPVTTDPVTTDPPTTEPTTTDPTTTDPTTADLIADSGPSEDSVE
ncbi:hypothetical protein [Rhodococcoides navarretei]|uniref:Serine/threonine protein kinase n=1 Tax=Rhodococcus navarretei TaxID=3128981 RepID=A0ABU9D230_9NOCA